MKPIIPILAFLAMSACIGGVVTLPVEPVPAAPEDTCAARPYANLVGQDATALERVLIMRPIRLLRPDTMVTMDFNPNRINFHIDAANRITRITCG